MATYTVKGHKLKRENIEGKKGGTFKVLELTLANEQGVEKGGIEWFTKQTTQPPEIGSKLEGDVTKGEYGLKFKKAYNGGGFQGGGRGMSDEDIRRITRSHSQEMAIRAMALWGPEEWGQHREITVVKKLKEWIDWFDADVAGKTPAAPADFQATSDTPVDTSDLDSAPPGRGPDPDDPPF